jgi:hypothetical protein
VRGGGARTGGVRRIPFFRNDLSYFHSIEQDVMVASAKLFPQITV